MKYDKWGYITYAQVYYFLRKTEFKVKKDLGKKRLCIETK